jgi:hypothetical protein
MRLLSDKKVVGVWHFHCATSVGLLIKSLVKHEFFGYFSLFTQNKFAAVNALLASQTRLEICFFV